MTELQAMPDFDFEKGRLAYTIHYMQEILRQSDANIQASQEKISTALKNVEYLDSSDSFLNVLTNARFFDLALNEKEALEKVLGKPYFARIDFERDGEKRELLYIGKTSLFNRETHDPIIVDWRSPVANVYYDGRLGQITYEVNEETLTGHLYKKRQYKIEAGELINYQDVDLTTNDQLLQEALAQNADTRLTEIVATIQQEQNEIIRAHLRQPVIVQGAAGSGKTTIALHRISYFLYTMGRHFDPAKLMILAPNNLFIGYISDVLPELGVNKIHQLTFSEYIQKALSIKVKIENPHETLEQMTLHKISETSEVTRIKSSLFFKAMLDRYVEHYIHEMSQQFEDVFIEKYRIMKAAHLRNLFLNEFHYLPVEKRLERIKKIITNEVRRKTKSVLAVVNAKYEDTIERAMNGIRNDEKRRAAVVRFLDERDARIPKIKEEAKHVVSSYMSKFKKVKVKPLYREIVTSKEQLAFLAPEWSYMELEQFYKAHVKERWSLDDLAAIYYLHAKIKGLKEDWKMRAVFIDEVQDYSIFQLASLKEGLETDLFTMVGDLAQGIHSYRSFQSWEDVRALFPRANYMQLQKSYRTTIEIMDEANTVLDKMKLQLPTVQPVVRHGESPTTIQLATTNTEELTARLKLIYENSRAQGYQSVALITKNQMEAEQVAKAINEIPVQLLTEQSILKKESLLIVPAYLAKGLEFDAVIIYSAEGFANTLFEQKLLYVAMTRAMHALYFIQPSATI